MINAESIKATSDKQKDLLISFLKAYSSPSFGSMSKRDTDVALFSMMQELGIINMNPQIYEVVSLLHVTSSKARNLIYEASLRRNNENTLNRALLKHLQEPRFLATSDKMIAIEIDDPLLIDHLKFKLRKLNHITDGSFNPGLVKMSYEAYASLFGDTLPQEVKDRLLNDIDTEELKQKFGISNKDDSPSKIRKCITWTLNEIRKLALKKESEHWMQELHTQFQTLATGENIQNVLNWIQENAHLLIQQI
jgi:hypothetical protein